MLPNYQPKIADFYDISIGTVQKFVPNFLVKKCMFFIMKLATLFKARIETKKNASCVRIQSITMAKTIYRISHNNSKHF